MWQRQALAWAAYQAGGSLKRVAQEVRLAGLPRYHEGHASVDLWDFTHQERLTDRRQAPVSPYDFDLLNSVASPDGHRNFALAGIAGAFLDLETGAPCTLGLGIKTYWPHLPVYCVEEKCEAPGERHRCAQDALAWLTSADFLLLCHTLDWPWQETAGAVITEATKTMKLFPWLVLIPAMVWRLACVLEGEAGVLGTRGMYYVADTMLARREGGDSWEAVLAAYYGNQCPPSEGAMQMAARMLADPWQSNGRRYVYSETDRVNMGWRKGDFIYGKEDYLLHFSREWPGAELGKTGTDHGTTVRAP